MPIYALYVAISKSTFRCLSINSLNTLGVVQVPHLLPMYIREQATCCIDGQQVPYLVPTYLRPTMVKFRPNKEAKCHIAPSFSIFFAYTCGFTFFGEGKKKEKNASYDIEPEEVVRVLSFISFYSFNHCFQTILPRIYFYIECSVFSVLSLRFNVGLLCTYVYSKQSVSSSLYLCHAYTFVIANPYLLICVYVFFYGMVYVTGYVYCVILHFYSYRMSDGVIFDTGDALLG